MTIKVGDRIPEAILTQMSEEWPQAGQHSRLLRRPHRGAVFSARRLYAQPAQPGTCPVLWTCRTKIKARGVDAIACTAVNDVFVMDAWGKAANAEGIDMLADGNAEFAKALGLELDASGFGMGTRGQRFALVADDGVVTGLFIEGPGEFKVSSAEHVLSQL